MTKDITVLKEGSRYVLTFVDQRGSEVIRMPFDATPEAAGLMAPDCAIWAHHRAIGLSI